MRRAAQSRLHDAHGPLEEKGLRILQDYSGANVRHTAERLAHVFDHPEMIDHEAALEETLRKPQLEFQSTPDETATLTYRWCFGTKVGDKWLRVVVRHTAEDAFVLTAYLTDVPKKIEQLWPTT